MHQTKAALLPTYDILLPLPSGSPLPCRLCNWLSHSTNGATGIAARSLWLEAPVSAQNASNTPCTMPFWLWTQGAVVANTSCAIARLNWARASYRKLYRPATLNHPHSCILYTANYALPQCAPPHQLDVFLCINLKVMSHNLTFRSSISAFRGSEDSTLQIFCESEWTASGSWEDGISYAILDQVWCVTIQSKKKENQRTKQEKRALKEDEEKQIRAGVKVQL